MAAFPIQASKKHFAGLPSGSVFLRNIVCALRTLAPERGCVSSHFPLRGVRLHSGAFFI